MTRLPRPDPRLAGRLLRTGVVAVTGGLLFARLGLPAAWLTGSMTLTAAVALAGAPVGLTQRLRDLAFLLLSASIGSRVTPESVDEMRAWPASVALLAFSVVTTLVVSAVYFERISGWDRVTARFAAMPGALSSVVVLAATSSADLPRVVLAQSIRVFTLVALMPPLLGFGSGGVTSSAVETAPTPLTSGAGEVLAVLAAGAAARRGSARRPVCSSAR